MKRKKLPGFIQNPILVEIFQTRPGRVFTNWVLQGMLYMNPVEIVYKLLLDVVIALTIIWIFFESLDIYQILISLIIAHTINWVINCQPVALLMHMDIGKNNAEKFIDYIGGLEKRIKTKKYLSACASYGSLSVGGYKPTSDIDIRVIMKKGLISKIRAAHFCFIERFRALFVFFPLDLYAFNIEEIHKKMSPKEPPVVFSDPDGVLKQTYNELVSFEDFDKQFREHVLPAHQ